MIQGHDSRPTYWCTMCGRWDFESHNATNCTRWAEIKKDSYRPDFVMVPDYGTAQQVNIPENVARDRGSRSAHYRMEIEPLEYILKNNLSFCVGNVIKYVSRYEQKEGIRDLYKARDYLDILIAETEKK